jgi:hypothetical protein
VANLVAAALALIIAQPQAPLIAPTIGVPATAADIMLTRYRLRIQDLKQPPNMVVEYTETRSGPTRVVTENHRLYRDDAGHERNETTAINGLPVTRPKVSIYSRLVWAYGADRFFVDSAVYQIASRGTVEFSGHKAYSYAVVLKEAGAFAVTDLELDAREALPLREHFVATSSMCSATGSIDFGRAGAYWMPKIVSVTCPVLASPDAAVITPATASYRDTIRFSSYAFPAAIPAQVFGLPPTPAPGSTRPPPL